MSDYPMLISNKLHSFRNFEIQIYEKATESVSPRVQRAPSRRAQRKAGANVRVRRQRVPIVSYYLTKQRKADGGSNSSASARAA